MSTWNPYGDEQDTRRFGELREALGGDALAGRVATALWAAGIKSPAFLPAVQTAKVRRLPGLGPKGVLRIETYQNAQRTNNRETGT